MKLRQKDLDIAKERLLFAMEVAIQNMSKDARRTAAVKLLNEIKQHWKKK